VRHWRRVPALNTDATFIDDLADAVIEALPYVSRFGGRGSAGIASGSFAEASVPIGGALRGRDCAVLARGVFAWIPSGTRSPGVRRNPIALRSRA
jgi:hypothetical protein